MSHHSIGLKQHLVKQYPFYIRTLNKLAIKDIFLILMQGATKSYRKHHFNCEIFESIPFHIKIKSKIVCTGNSEGSIEILLQLT